jgi:hypothetical protein
VSFAKLPMILLKGQKFLVYFLFSLFVALQDHTRFVLPVLDSPSHFSACPGCPLIIIILLLIIKILLLPEVLKWNGGFSCDSNHQTFRSIYVSFDHIDVSCFHLASDFPVTEDHVGFVSSLMQ